MYKKLKLYFAIESTGLFRYWLEQTLQFFFGWIPTIFGIGIRSIVYRLMMTMKGNVVIQSGCIFKRPKEITLHSGVYIDHRVYMHATPNGIEIGPDSRIMFGAELHVYNFRAFPQGKIKIGKNTVIGPHSIVMGHGGTIIGDNVGIAPRVSILPVNHVYEDSSQPIREQGVTSKGIIIEDDAWIGSGVIILDGVHIGKGSVIGAGAVVTHDIPQYSLAIGMPARVIRNWEPKKTLPKKSE